MKKACLSLLLLVTIATSTANAGPIMWVDDNRGQLGTVDVATGVATVIGLMGDVMTDIAFDPLGNLWAINFGQLFTVNKTTAVSTLVGNLGVAGANALVFATDGTLYMASNATTDLYTVNTSTGAATSLGNMGFASAGDLAFNGGNLYLADGGNQLVRINLANLALSAVVGPFGVANMFGLATANNGILYGVSGTIVYAINTATGAATLVTPYAPGLGDAFGEAFFDEAGAGTPEPGTLLLVGGGLAAAIRRRRQRRA